MFTASLFMFWCFSFSLQRLYLRFLQNLQLQSLPLLLRLLPHPPLFLIPPFLLSRSPHLYLDQRTHRRSHNLRARPLQNPFLRHSPRPPLLPLLPLLLLLRLLPSRPLLLPPLLHLQPFKKNLLCHRRSPQHLPLPLKNLQLQRSPHCTSPRSKKMPLLWGRVRRTRVRVEERESSERGTSLWSELKTFELLRYVCVG